MYMSVVTILNCKHKTAPADVRPSFQFFIIGIGVLEGIAVQYVAPSMQQQTFCSLKLSVPCFYKSGTTCCVRSEYSVAKR